VTPRICLVVDNPLRDLDGLVLVARQLALMGAETYLVPMYDQVFDVPLIAPDLVLLNYLRPNNYQVAAAHMRAGVRVGVLDTEGAGGKDAREFAKLVLPGMRRVDPDLYCVWGPDQMAAVKDALGQTTLNDHGVLQLTGCPRYDYCAQPWRNALPPVEVAGRFVLINTNFPVVNPRFSAGPDAELKAMLATGFTEEFARRYIADAKVAKSQLCALLDNVVARFPQTQFVLRPHPFESADGYAMLAKRGNFAVIQRGTSLEWLNAASALIHMNCSTALEAAMLGVPALSPEWLNAPALRLEGPQSLSRCARDADELVQAIAEALDNTANARTSVSHPSITGVYHLIDGMAAQRVADALFDTLQRPRKHHAAAPRRSLRARATSALRNVLGYRGYTALRDAALPAQRRQQRESKRFTLAQVNALLQRLQRADGSRREVRAHSTQGDRRGASGRTLRIAADS
jgi:surface carbohydrate biosynthesis protein